MIRIKFLILSLLSTSALAKAPFYKLRQSHDQSVLVKRLSDGKIIYENNKDLALSPASVTKLFTSAAMLAKFSPAHKFETTFFYTGKNVKGVIEGNLHIVGSGDPLLINEKLWQMAADFKHLGIREIKGDIVIDNSLFDGSTWDKSRRGSRHSSNNAYDAPVSAFGVNFNTFPIAFAPGYKKNDKAFMSIDPYPIKGINLINGVTTSNNTSLRARRSSKNGQVNVSSSGSISPGSSLKKLYRSVADPTTSGGEQIRSFLREFDIEVRGSVKSGRKPRPSKFLYKIESYELSRMISGLNKYSNNYIADVLIKRLGASFYKGKEYHPGSLKAGMSVLKDFLVNEVNISSGAKLHNGSGLDTRNRVSASHVMSLLEYMYKRMDIFPEFLSSLPASGWDGTLEDRFRRQNLKHLVGKVRAKTGTLTRPISVSSLAGYMGHPKHGMLAFVIIENGKAKKEQANILDLRARQESALSIITKRY